MKTAQIIDKRVAGNGVNSNKQITVHCMYPVNGNDIWYTDIVISELLYERSHFNHGIY